MFEIYDYQYDPVFEWGGVPEEPYAPAPPQPSPPQFDGTEGATPDLNDWIFDVLNPTQPSDDRLDQLDEAQTAYEHWLKDAYGEDYLDYLSSGGVTTVTLEFDLKSDLIDGKASAWNAIWEFAEYVYGVEDIRSDPIFMASIAMTIAKSLFGTSEGWLWDSKAGRLVQDPDHVPPSEADDESGNEDDDQSYYDDGDSFVFDDWEDDGGDDWSVTMEIDEDTGDGGRDL